MERNGIWHIEIFQGKLSKSHKKGSGVFKDGIYSAFLSAFSPEGGLDWSPTARVQRGSSQTARCTSTGDHLVCPLLLLDDDLNTAVLGTPICRVVAVPVPCGREVAAHAAVP